MILQLSQAAATSDAALIWGFILMAAAIVLLVVELFIPSGGLIGLVAGVSAIASLVAFFQYDTMWGFVFLGVYVVLGPIAVYYGFRWWLTSPMSRGIILGSSVTGTDADAGDSESSAYLNEQQRRARLEELRGLIGATGVAETAMRPVGTIIIEGERLEALADTAAIDAGMPIVVTDVYDNQVKVRPID